MFYHLPPFCFWGLLIGLLKDNKHPLFNAPSPFKNPGSTTDYNTCCKHVMIKFYHLVSKNSNVAFSM